MKRTEIMVEKCKLSDAEQNPGATLGLVLGTAGAQLGRDKVTLICSRSIYDSGAWLEQLLPESA